MTCGTAKIVDLVSQLSRQEAIDLVEQWARDREKEAALQAGCDATEWFFEMLRQAEEKRASNGDASCPVAKQR
jgi:hypothetical protein